MTGKGKERGIQVGRVGRGFGGRGRRLFVPRDWICGRALIHQIDQNDFYCMRSCYTHQVKDVASIYG